MGNYRKRVGPIPVPEWAATLGAAADSKTSIRACCDTCSESRDVDLVALIALNGRDYFLINRRCRCRLTPGCVGWNRFFYLHGVYRRMWTNEQSDRWMEQRWRDLAFFNDH